jgi:predicted transcriptional regulator
MDAGFSFKDCLTAVIILINSYAFDTLMIIDPLEQVSGLYFELSNPDRLSILHALSDAPGRLSELTKNIGTTHQQCLRHLRRLTEVRLVEKNQDGFYKLTSYGELVLQLTPSLVFVSKNSSYFASHTLSHIPGEFVSRIGELSESVELSNVMEALSEIESIVKASEDYLHVILNKRTHSIRPYIAEAIRRGVQVKSISITSYTPTHDVKREINQKDELDIIEAESEGTALVADQTDFPVYLYLSEKTTFLAFPLHDGSFDYTGFHSSDPKAVKFCSDLFDQYWVRTSVIPAAELVDRHIKYLEHFGLHPKIG